MIDLGALPIPDADGYFAFPDGRIWSSKRNKFLKPQRTGMYRHVCILKNGRQHTQLIHRLCMSALHGRKLRRNEVVEHINHDPADNRWVNLRVTTQAENIARGHKDGRQPVGENVGNAKLTAAKVREIRAAGEMGASQRHLAREFGVSKTLIGCVLRREWWRHVD